MTEIPPEQREEEQDIAPPPEAMPAWVPVAIGVVLISLGALAVITGLRYREQTLVRIIHPRSQRSAAAPPGEPEAGASLVFPGESGSNVPVAREHIGDNASHADVTGGPGGITSVVRIWARRGMKIAAQPDDAVVYVNDVPVGQASQFDSEDEIYDFAQPGSYIVKLVAPGYKERQFVVIASETAEHEIADIKTKLEKVTR